MRQNKIKVKIKKEYLVRKARPLRCDHFAMFRFRVTMMWLSYTSKTWLQSKKTKPLSNKYFFKMHFLWYYYAPMRMAKMKNDKYQVWTRMRSIWHFPGWRSTNSYNLENYQFLLKLNTNIPKGPTKPHNTCPQDKLREVHSSTIHDTSSWKRPTCPAGRDAIEGSRYTAGPGTTGVWTAPVHLLICGFFSINKVPVFSFYRSLN